MVFESNEAATGPQTTILQTMKAQSANRILRSINSEGRIFHPLQKEFPSGSEENGGIHLANTLCPASEEQWQIWPPLAKPEIGDTPPSTLLPKSLKEIGNLSQAEILRLIAFYNESFGIRPEDSLETRQDKFRRWCIS
jgi:hypothetical protein